MWVLLSLVIFLGGFVRVWGINQVPPELFGDEVDVGYQAYSLLKTGADIYGQVLPTYIHSLAEWRAPVLMYATVPTISIFGLNEWGVRLPEVIWGTLGVAILGLLVLHTTGSRVIAVMSAVFLAIMPWHIHYSRAAFESVIMLNFIMLGTLLLLKKRFALCALLFVLAMYTYSTAVVFAPLWIVVVLWLRKIKPSFTGSVVFIGLLIPLGLSIVTGPGRGRYATLSYNNDQERLKQVLLLRQIDPSGWGRVVVNKYESFGHLFADNYLRSFSTDFLFIRGDPIYRHSIQVVGQLLPFTFPLVLIGLGGMVKHRMWGWLLWLVIAPLPASLTVDGGYHATRLFLMVPPLAAAGGAGAWWLWRRWRAGMVVLGGLIIFQFLWSGYYYAVFYRQLSWRWWSVGYKSALTRIVELSPNYQKVILNNTYEPTLIRFLFWTKYDPELLHRQFAVDQPQANILPGFDGFKLGDKYYFGAWSNRPIDYQVGSLYLLSQRDDEVGDGQIIYTSSNSSGQPILFLVTKHD